ncbi:DUF3618 domain-containing protein [Pseudoroseomonas wenyumeiae]
MSATTDPGNRSAADIEADVEQTRVRVAQTIDALRDSMSPARSWIRSWITPVPPAAPNSPATSVRRCATTRCRCC